MQYTSNINGCKKTFLVSFRIFFAQTIDEAVLTSTYNLCFRANIRKICLPCTPHFYYIKVSTLHGRVIMMVSMSVHYANTPMQYTAIFHGCKNVYFQVYFLNIFRIFAQNIDCGYTLEPPQ